MEVIIIANNNKHILVKPSSAHEYVQHAGEHSHYFTLNGITDGPYLSLHANGNIRVRCTFFSGVKHGEFKWYHEDGSLYVSCKYKNGAIHGEYEEFWPNNHRKELTLYRNGIRNGYSHTMNINGTTRTYTHFINGLRHGEYILCDKAGLQTNIYVYNMGALVKAAEN